MSALILFLGRAELSLSTPLVDSKSLKNEKTFYQRSIFNDLPNLRLVFLKSGQKNFGFMLFAILIINALGGALGGIYNIFLLNHSLLNFSYKDALFTLQLITLLAVIISSLTGNDYFGEAVPA